MSGSFDGTNFIGERGAGASAFPVWGKAGSIVIKRVPLGNKNVIQKIAVGLPRLALVVKVTAAQLAALRGKIGVEGTLVFGYESATARLESITGAAEQSAGHDVYFATLNLIRLASVGSTPSTARVIESGDTRVTESGDIRIVE
jgi:hypothetical protein